MSPTAHLQHMAVAIDIDPPFQQVLAAWLGARSYRVTFLPLSAALAASGHTDLVVCELAAPKQAGAHTLRQLAHTYPRAPLIAISARFVADTRCDALARQLGAQAALAKPCSRYDFDTALDAAVAMLPHTPPLDDHAGAAARTGR
jgi:CheY-like chemotaxis protein